MEKGVAIICAAYLETSEKFLPKPSLRLVANRLLTEKEIEKAARVLEEVTDELKSQF